MISDWIAEDDWLAMRAVAAGVAEPALLTDKETAYRALKLHKEIFNQIIRVEARESEAFKTLKKGWGYTLSVVNSAIPEAGFGYLQQLVGSQDKDIRGVVKVNLKKNR
jgi:hypothetical protein